MPIALAVPRQGNTLVDVRRHIAIVRSWSPLLVVAVLLAAGAAFAYSSLQPKVYEAKATLIVGQSLSGVSPDFDQLMVSQRLSTTYAAVATKRPILEKVIEELGLDVTVDDLAKRVRAEAALESTLLTITTQDTDPDRAAAIANGLADQLIEASASIQGQESEFQASVEADLNATQQQIVATQAEVEQLVKVKNRTVRQEATLATLEDRLASLRSTYVALLSYTSGGASNLLSVVEPAVAANSPVSPKTALNTLLAAVIGLLIALGLVAVLEYLDDRVKTREELEELTGVSILGQVEKMRGGRGRREMYRLATLLNPRSVAAEAYRTLRTNIEFASVDAPIRTLLVTSSIPGEGKTVTAANLAVAFAQAGRRVLLVDADLRKPGVHLVFDLPNTQRAHVAAPQRCGDARGRRAGDRAGQPADPDDRPAAAQPGRAPGLAADADRTRAAQGRRRSPDLRQPAASSGHRRGDPELVPRRHSRGRRRRRQSPWFASAWAWRRSPRRERTCSARS